MAWIESHQELGRHPKTRKLARALDISRPAVVGHLHYLWWWALDFAQDGDLSRYDADELAEAALWDGDPEAFVEALIAAGFIERATRHLHDWDEYAGKLIDQRRANARRQSEFRNRHKTPTEPEPVVTHNTDVTPSNGYVTVTSQLRNAATEQYLTVPNSTEETPTVATAADVADATETAQPAAGDSAPAARSVKKSSSSVELPERRASDTTDRIYWTRILKEAADNERIPLLVHMAHDKLSVNARPGGPAYGRIGKLAKQHGASRVASCILQAAANHIDGDPLDYLVKVVDGQIARASPRQPVGAAAAAAATNRHYKSVDDSVPEGY